MDSACLSASRSSLFKSAYLLPEPLFHILTAIWARQSASEQFPTSIPGFPPLPPFKKKTNTSYLLLMHRRSLNSSFWEKTRSWPSNCHRAIPADPPIIQRNRFALSLKRFCSRAEQRDWHLLRSPQPSRKKKFAKISDTSSDLCICQLKSYFFPVGRHHAKFVLEEKTQKIHCD